MPTKSSAWAFCAALSVLASPAFAVEAHYVCADGTRLTATFSSPDGGPGSAVLVFAGSTGKTTLPQALSADGGRYESGDTEFWVKGNGATLTRSGSATTCRAG